MDLISRFSGDDAFTFCKDYFMSASGHDGFYLGLWTASKSNLYMKHPNNSEFSRTRQTTTNVGEKVLKYKNILSINKERIIFSFDERIINFFTMLFPNSF